MSKPRNSNKEQNRIYFVSTIIELYKRKKKMSGEAAVSLFREHGVLQWLYDNYGILHTESEENVIKEIHGLFAI